MTLWVLHVDLDQFLAAVEMLRRPELKGLPVVVGGDGDPTKRGVVSTASYEARALGVSSGTPMRTAARRIPDAVFLPVDREHYEGVSAEVMAALRADGTVVEILGWDEAFLAVDSEDPEAVARAVQHRVRDATGLDCTVGIGRNRLQA
jgi:DNA polymerase-4